MNLHEAGVRGGNMRGAGILLVVLFAMTAQAEDLMPVGLTTSAIKKKGTTGWSALWKDKLVATKVTFTPAHHPIEDDGKPESVKSGVEITVPGMTETERPVMLLRGVTPRAELKPLLATDAAPLYEFGKPLTLGDATFEAIKLGERSGRIELRVGEMKQTLFECAECDQDGWSVRWAGDLDGDGKIDLLITAGPHYAQETSRLFLSSKARKGQLVNEVAKYEAPGC